MRHLVLAACAAACTAATAAQLAATVQATAQGSRQECVVSDVHRLEVDLTRTEPLHVTPPYYASWNVDPSWNRLFFDMDFNDRSFST